jgi:hypothetical protein
MTRWWRSRGRQQLLSLPLQRWPDFRKWVQRSEFKLGEAAALWLDAEPWSPMWWRARRKLRQLRVAIASGMGASQPQPLTAPMERGRRPIASGDASPTVHRHTLRALAEKEGVHPLFPYPEFRFRGRDRDQAPHKHSWKRALRYLERGERAWRPSGSPGPRATIGGRASHKPGRPEG